MFANPVDQTQEDINANLHRLRELSAILQTEAEGFPTLDVDDIQPAVACIAPYSADGCFYRGEIVSVKSGDRGQSVEAGVRFVDYGSFENIPCHSLRRMSEEFLSLPPQSIRCCLHGIDDAASHDPSTVIELMKVVTGRQLLAVVTGVSYYDLEVIVHLYDADEYRQYGANTRVVYRPLIDAGLLHRQSHLSLSNSIADDEDDNVESGFTDDK
jgi:hypothetical protein